MAVGIETHQRGHVRGATRGEGPGGKSAEPRKLKLKRQGGKRGVLLTDQPIGKRITVKVLPGGTENGSREGERA